MKGNNQRALLVEIMIAVLFFSLCATVILETFVSARTLGNRAQANTDVLVHMQDMAEQIYAAQDAEALILAAGYVLSDGGWSRTLEDCCVFIERQDKQTEVGILQNYILTASRDDTCIVEIPCVRYVPGEVGA